MAPHRHFARAPSRSEPYSNRMSARLPYRSAPAVFVAFTFSPLRVSDPLYCFCVEATLGKRFSRRTAWANVSPRELKRRHRSPSSIPRAFHRPNVNFYSGSRLHRQKSRHRLERIADEMVSCWTKQLDRITAIALDSPQPLLFHCISRKRRQSCLLHRLRINLDLFGRRWPTDFHVIAAL